jgi:glycosyltransferase involved in cell wall biosynthesis
VDIGIVTERMLLGYGVEIAIDQLARGLQKRGHNIRVYCRVNDESYSDAPYEIVTVHPAGWRNLSEYEAASYRAVRRFLKREEILIVESFPFFYTGYLSEKPWIAVDHGVVPSKWFRWPRRKYFEYIATTQYQKYFTRATKIACITDFLRNRLNPEIRAKATVIHNGADHYRRDFLVNLDGMLGEDGPRALYVGRSIDTTPYKNTRQLLESWKTVSAKHPHAKLIMACACSTSEEEILRSRGATVIRNLAPEFMPSIYNACNIYATPTMWETFDLPVMEAAYFGMPTVAFSIGAHPEIILNGETGFLAETPEQFTEYIMKLIEDSSLRESMGSKARGRAESQFNWSSCVEAFDRLIQTL